MGMGMALEVQGKIVRKLYSTNSYIATLEQGLLPIHPEGLVT